MTYCKSTFKTYFGFTKLISDERVELENGAPVDIPAGHWIDVRVNMPSNSIYNQKQVEAEFLVPYQHRPCTVIHNFRISQCVSLKFSAPRAL